MAWEALKQLVIDGLISVATNNGFSYKISAAGLAYANKMESAYSMEYREIARVIFQKFSNYSEKELSLEIDKKAIKSARRK